MLIHIPTDWDKTVIFNQFFDERLTSSFLTAIGMEYNNYNILVTSVTGFGQALTNLILNFDNFEDFSAFFTRKSRRF
jgi:hypothetical protein